MKGAIALLLCVLVAANAQAVDDWTEAQVL